MRRSAYMQDTEDWTNSGVPARGLCRDEIMLVFEIDENLISPVICHSMVCKYQAGTGDSQVSSST